MIEKLVALDMSNGMTYIGYVYLTVESYISGRDILDRIMSDNPQGRVTMTDYLMVETKKIERFEVKRIIKDGWEKQRKKPGEEGYMAEYEEQWLIRNQIETTSHQDNLDEIGGNYFPTSENYYVHVKISKNGIKRFGDETKINLEHLVAPHEL